MKLYTDENKHIRIDYKNSIKTTDNLLHIIIKRWWLKKLEKSFKKIYSCEYFYENNKSYGDYYFLINVKNNKVYVESFFRNDLHTFIKHFIKIKKVDSIDEIYELYKISINLWEKHSMSFVKN